MEWEYALLSREDNNNETTIKLTYFCSNSEHKSNNVYFTSHNEEEGEIQNQIYTNIAILGTYGYELFFINPKESKYFFKKCNEE